MVEDIKRDHIKDKICIRFLVVDTDGLNCSLCCIVTVSVDCVVEIYDHCVDKIFGVQGLQLEILYSASWIKRSCLAQWLNVNFYRL